MAGPRSLLDRLGGRDGLAVMVAGVVARLRGDRRFARGLGGAELARYELDLLDHLATALDGDRPAALPGAARTGALLRCLAETLSAAGVARTLRREVVSQIACACIRSRATPA